jgi:alpha-tubulin suppressor-like RCC1 family protein
MKTFRFSVVAFAFLLFWLPGQHAFAISDGYYDLQEVASVWEGTPADRLLPETTEFYFNYGNSATVEITLPWSFRFYGTIYNQLSADTDGNIWFGGATPVHSYPLASTGPVIAAWNNDLNSYFYGGVFVEHKTSPERIVVQWRSETFADAGTGRLNDVEVVLYQDGTIRTDYLSFDPNATGDFGSGIAKGDGSFLSVSSIYGQAATLVGRSFQFDPDLTGPALTVNEVITPTIISSQTLSGTVEAGVKVTITADTAVEIGPVTYPSAGVWVCNVSSLAENDNNFTVTSWDLSNNYTVVPVSIIFSFDTDGDGILDYLDPDDDDDGIPDFSDAFRTDPNESVDTDGDGLGNNADPDDDNDGIPDDWEILQGLDPLNGADANLDIDGDGLTTLQEYDAGTDLFTIDTDGDGVIDSDEVNVLFTDPTDKFDLFGQDIVLSGVTVRIDGNAYFNSLTLTDNAVITALDSTTERVSLVVIEVAGDLTIDETSKIDVSGRGYLGGWRGGNSSRYGRTSGNTTVGGSDYGSSGSYGGLGGQCTEYGVTYWVGNVYGDLRDPKEPGSGGGGFNAAFPGGSGGGLVRISARSLTVNGAILADGMSGPSLIHGAGSGGGIRIDVGTLAGIGTISAQGLAVPTGQRTRGGGGRIALYCDTMTFSTERVFASGGQKGNGYYPNENGGAGTIYIKEGTQPEGAVIVDNRGVSTNLSRPSILPSVGKAQVFEVTPDSLKISSGNFKPGAAKGLRFRPDQTRNAIFTVVDNDAKTLYIDPFEGDLTQATVAGATMVGVYLFDQMTISEKAQVRAFDRIEIVGDLLIDDGTLVVNDLQANNIVLQNGGTLIRGGVTFTAQGDPDLTSPSLTVASVTSPTMVPTQTLSGTVEIGATVTISADTAAEIGPVIYPAAGTWQCTVSHFAENDNTFTVTARDIANNPSTAPVVITFHADTDGDGVPDTSDAFAIDSSASFDSDGDGAPDAWNAGKTQADSSTGLSLDALPTDIAASIDSDGDGFPDSWNPGKSAVDSTTGLTLDVFPTDSAASLDSDGDGFPDSWNPGKSAVDSTSGLTLDAFPTDPTESLDTDGDGIGNNADPDDDNDGVADGLDPFPTDIGSVTVTPTSLIASEKGEISLEVSYLVEAGGTIFVDQVADVNGNGAADSGEPVIRSFSVTDGVSLVNPNVPGDDDGSADGAISITLGYNNTLDVYHAPGAYVFRAAASATAEAAFSVTPVAQSQTLAGTVTDGSNPVAGALVQLTDKWQRPVAWAVTDALGNFLFDVPQAGEYRVVPMAFGFATPKTAILLVSVASDTTLTGVDLTLAAGTWQVSGQVYNAAGGEGISGVLVQAESADTLGIALTDALGNYELMLPAGDYAFTLPATSFANPAFRGFCLTGTEGLNLGVTGDVTGNDFALTPGSTLLSGRVTDEFGLPVSGLPVVGLSMPSGQALAQSVTDADGNYALRLLVADNWAVTVEFASAQSLGYLANTLGGLSTTAGSLAGQDLVGHGIDTWLEGTVAGLSGDPLAGITVSLSDGATVQGAMVTANDGTYRFGVYEGSWVVRAATEEAGYQAADGTIIVSTSGQTSVADFLAIPTDLPDLVVGALSASFSALAGEEVIVDYQVVNQGSGAAGAFTTTFYFSMFSMDAAIDPVDLVMDSVGVASLAPAGSTGGSFTWQIPAGLAEGNYHILASVDPDDVIYESNGLNNTLEAAQTYSVKVPVRVLSPNGGEVLSGGSTYTVQWAPATDAQIYHLSYSLDGGTTWSYAAQVTGATTVSWRAPFVTADQTNCRFLVMAHDGADLYLNEDVSDASFTIEVGALPVQLTSPNGGEVLNGGATYTVQWTEATGAQFYDLNYSLDGGASWTFASKVTAATSYAWRAPLVAAQKEDCLFKVTARDGADLVLNEDVSDAPFTLATKTDRRIDGGYSHSVLLQEDGSLWTMGGNGNGELGIGWGGGPRYWPNQVGTDTDWRTIAAGYYHTLSIKNDGSLWGWGGNWNGVLGDGTTASKATPQQIGTNFDWTQVAAGIYHSVALKNDGTLWAWGLNDHGQLGDGSNTKRNIPTRIGNDSDWVKIACGLYHTLAVKSDGTLWAWGYNNYGQLGEGTTQNQNVPVQVGSSSNWVAVGGGYLHSMALKDDGTLWGWGYNVYGQLGDGTATTHTTPSPCNNGSDWIDVSTGSYHTLALKADGTLWGWGRSFEGQVGTGSNYFVLSTPGQIGQGADWVEFSARMNHSMALKVDGTVWGWGPNFYGELGTGDTDHRSVPTGDIFDLDGDGIRVPDDICPNDASNDADGDGVCGNLDAYPIDITEWADYDGDGMGDNQDLCPMDAKNDLDGDGICGNVDNCPLAANLDQLDSDGNGIGDACGPFVLDLDRVAGGYLFSVTIGDDGSLWTWGQNNYGQLGNGTTTDSASPLLAGIDSDWADVSAGYYHALALKADGSLWAWGYNNYGQLGDGTNVTRPEPVRIGTGNDWVKVEATYYQSFALKSDGSLWAWGNNGYGNLGLGSTLAQWSPTQVGTDHDWVEVAPGSYHTLALKSDGTLWAWGFNGYGQFGDGTTVDSLVPVRVGQGSEWKNISAGYLQSLAMMTDGTLWAWGNNLYGQLGDGTVIHRSTPGQIGNENNWEISVSGLYHSLATKTDGTLWSWGYNGHGELGDGTRTRRTVPVQVSAGPDWSHLAGGVYHSLARNEVGTFWSWGYNTMGQLGLGTLTETLVPNMIPQMLTLDGDGDGDGVPDHLDHCPGFDDNLDADRDGLADGCDPDDDNDGVADVSDVFPFDPAESVDTDGDGVGNNVDPDDDNDGVLDAGDNCSLVANADQIDDDFDGIGDVCDPMVNIRKTISAGFHHTLAIRDGGSLWAWGWNFTGQLGDGTTVDKHTPVETAPGNDWKQIAAGGSKTLALKNDGTIWTWGTSPSQFGNDSDWVQLFSSSANAFALKADGTLWAWGNNTYGQLGDGTKVDRPTPVQVGTDNDWLHVATASYFYHTLAIKRDGTLWAWGSNVAGQLGIDTTGEELYPVQVGSDTDWVHVATGDRHTLALKEDGTLWGWGGNAYGQIGDGTNTEWHSPVQIGSDSDWWTVEVGSSHSLGLKKDGTLWAWGYNNEGELGLGIPSNVTKSTPTRLGTDVDWEEVTCGYWNSFARKEDDSVWGWGKNSEGQLGIMVTEDQFTPQRIYFDSDNDGFENKADPCPYDPQNDGDQDGICGNFDNCPGASNEDQADFDYDGHGDACDIDNDNDLMANDWEILYGLNPFDLSDASLDSDGDGLSNFAEFLAETFPNSVDSDVDGIGDGSDVCPLDFENDADGDGVCANVDNCSSSPNADQKDSDYDGIGDACDANTLLMRKIATSYFFSVVVKDDGSLWSFGLNSNGQLGDGSTEKWPIPIQVGADYDWHQVSVGQSHVLALKSNGTLWSWGYNGYGQLGDGTTIEKHFPVQIGTDTDWVLIEAGAYHSMAIKSDGTLWGWGSNFSCELGDGINSIRHTPRMIGVDNNWLNVAASLSFTLGVKSDGTLWAWGRNNVGQLGTGTTVNQRSPVQVGAANDWFAVSTGASHTVALKRDGTLWAWGVNYYGQIGDGTVIDRYSPVQIGSDSDWIQLTAGAYHSLAIKEDGTLWGWGYNGWYQLGLGASGFQYSPVRIGNDSDWYEVAGGGWHTVARKTVETFWGWGHNLYGQNGDGTTTQPGRTPKMILAMPE